VDHIIDYSKQDVVQEVMRITGGKGVDIVYDSTYSTSSFAQSSQCVSSNGTWLRLGPWGQAADDSEARKILESRGVKAKYGDFGRYWFNPEYQSKLSSFVPVMQEVVELYEKAKVRPRVCLTIPFEAEALEDAFRKSEKGTLCSGKAVVQIET